MGQWLLPRRQTHVRFVGRASSEFPVIDLKIKIKGEINVFPAMSNKVRLIFGTAHCSYNIYADGILRHSL